MFQNHRNIKLSSFASAFSSNIHVHFTNNQWVKVIVTYPYSIDVLTFDPNSNSEPKRKSLILCNGKDTSINNMILQARFVNINGILLIVILYSNGIQFYKENGFKTIRYIPATDLPMISNHDNFDFYFKGLINFNSKIIIGHSTGALYGFSCLKEKFFLKIKIEWYHRSHQFSIADLDSNKKYLASCDSNSIIKIWEPDETGFTVKLTLEGRFGIPFTCIKLYDDVVIAGQSSGHIRIFSIEEKRILTEIMAHVKIISSIDIVLETGMMITASEDTFIQIWQLKNIKNCWIKHLFSIHNPNSLLIGCAFLDKVGNNFASVSYDSNNLRLYQIKLSEQ